MGEKSIARNDKKAKKHKGDGSDDRIANDGGKEEASLRENGLNDSVDFSEERKGKKKKNKETKKPSVDGMDGRNKNGGDIAAMNDEEDRPEKPKKGKREKEGSDDMVKKVKINSKRERGEKDGDELRGDIVGSENDNEGDNCAKENKKKRKRENASDGIEEKMEGDEVGKQSIQKKKSKKKRENGFDGVEDKMQTDEEGGGGKKIKERKSENASVGAESRVETDEEESRRKKKKKETKSRVVSDVEGNRDKKKKKTESANVSGGEEGKAVTDGKRGRNKKTNKTKSVNVTDGLEGKGTTGEGNGDKKKKKLGRDDVSDDVEIDWKTDQEEGNNKNENKTQSENVSNGTEDKMEIDFVGNGSMEKKKKKKSKSEGISSDREVQGKKNTSDKLNADDDHIIGKKKKAKARKGEKRKAIAENDIQATGMSENPTPKRKSKKVSFSDDVVVFDDSPSKKKSKSDEKGLVQGKRFTPEEDEMVKESVLKYIEEHSLGDDGLDMVLNCRKHPGVKHCWKEIAKAIPWRPSASVYYRAHLLFERAEARKWTDEEREYVREFYEKHGADWKKLASELNKHRLHCKDTWRRNKLMNRNKGRWKQDEYQSLFDLVNSDLRMRALEERKSKHGMIRDNICWDAVSDRMATRNNSHCCMKWYTQLTSPMVAQGLWADTDDYLLIDALVSLDATSLADVDWDNLLEHREGSVSRKRWNQMVKYIGDYGKLSFSEQVEVLAKRYNPDCIGAREEFDGKPLVDGDRLT